MLEVQWDRLVILVIDDDPQLRELIVTTLRHYGVRTIHTAENGQKALQRLMDIPKLPDMIICDLQMPVMNGLEFTERLRASEYRVIREIPILVCTTSSQQGLVEQIVRLGVNGFIVKPFTSKGLYGRLEAALKKTMEGPDGKSRS